MKLGNEARVGLVVLLSIALGTAGVIFLNGVGLSPQTYYAQLEGGASLVPGSEVRLQGVKVGVVQDVTLDGQQKPVAKIALQKQTPPVKLLRSYRYTVNTSGIIGESFLDVSGPFQANAPVYAANNTGDPIRVKASTGLLAGLQNQTGPLINEFRGTLNKLNTTLDRVNKGVLNYQNQVKLAQALDGVSKLTTRASQTFGPNGFKVGFADQQAQRSLNQTFQNFALASGDARGVVQQAGVAAQQVSLAAKSLQGLTNGLGSSIGENRGALRGILRNLDSTTRNVAGLTETLNFTFKQGGFKENAQLAFGSLRRSAENIEATTSGFRAIADDPKSRAQLGETLTALRDSVTALRDTAQSIQKTVGDPETQAALRSTLQTLNTTAQNLQSTTANLRDTAQGLKNVVADPNVQNDLKAIPSELRGTLEATRGTAERLNSLLGGRNRRRQVGAPATSNPPSNGATPPDTSEPRSQNNDKNTKNRAPFAIDFTTRRFLDPADDGDADNRISERTYGDATLNANILGGPFRLGLSNLGEGSDLTLQSGRFLGQNGALRYGLYRSKLGIGAEYNLGRFSLEGNIYDPNHRSANAYLGFRLSRGLTVLAGRESVRNQRTNAFAVRLGR